MRNRLIIITAILLLGVALLGFGPRVSAISAENSKSLSSTRNSEYDELFIDTQYGKMRIYVWNNETQYLDWVEEGNKIMRNYLADYQEHHVIPMTVSEVYGNCGIPKGMSIGEEIWLNIDDSANPGDPIPMVVTIVHEQLHMNGGFNFSGLDFEENAELEEYVVYRLTRVVCTEYDSTRYANAKYGNGPELDLDNYLEELYEVFLGNQKASKELKLAVKQAFQ